MRRAASAIIVSRQVSALSYTARMRRLLALLVVISLPIAVVFESERAAGMAFVCFFAVLLDRLLMWPFGER